MVPSGLHFLSHLYYQCPVSYLHLAFQSHPNYFRLLVIIIIYSFYLSTSIFSYSTTLPSDFCCYLTTACCLTLFLSLCENIFHTSSLYEFPGEMPINFYPTQIDYCWQTKETVPPKPSVVSQWVYWGYFQDHDSLKGHLHLWKNPPHYEWQLMKFEVLNLPIPLAIKSMEESLLPRYPFVALEVGHLWILEHLGCQSPTSFMSFLNLCNCY